MCKPCAWHWPITGLLIAEDDYFLQQKVVWNTIELFKKRERTLYGWVSVAVFSDKNQVKNSMR